jgi:N-acetylglucosaminyldiphosphoundecaprenol N-acetyl-beta-D-mannosaminyltransferase
MEEKPTNDIEQTSFFGFKVSIFSHNMLVHFIEESLESKIPRVFYGYSMGIIARLKFQPEVYQYVNDFDLMVTDGRFFYLLSKIFGLPVKYDISIPYLTELVLKRGDKKKSSVMIIGSTEKNNMRATNNLKIRYKNIIVYDGYHGGDFSESEHYKLVSHVNKYKPDILLIGVSIPKKEYFAFKQKPNLNVKIIIPCGGMIDVLSGKVNRIPYVVKKLGLGWAWRIVQEPKRFLYDKSWQVYQVLFKIIPNIIYHRYLKKEVNFFLPSIYGINRKN